MPQPSSRRPRLILHRGIPLPILGRLFVLIFLVVPRQTTTANQRRFADYHQLANRMIGVAEKDTLAKVARVLAIHVAHYQAKFGKMSMEDTVRLLHADTLTDQEVGTAAEGMEYLVAVLGVAAGLVDDDPVH